MVDAKKFTAKRSKALRESFVEYSGGFEPHEAADEVDKFIEHWKPDWCSEMELWDWFQAWIKECESR